MSVDAPAQASGVEAEHKQIFADREWWRSAGNVINLELSGWTFRNSALFIDRETRQSVEMTGAVAARLVALSPPATVGAGEVVADERERLAKVVEGMLAEPVFAKSAPARMALAIAARNVRRGRALTSSEKFDNLTAAIEEDDPELANRLRCLATPAEGGRDG